MAGDYYELLQITSAASFDEVHKAYRALAMQYHPDRNPTPGAASTMVAINEAYAVLSEPSRRRQYDQARMKTEPFEIAGPVTKVTEVIGKDRLRVGSEHGTQSMVLQRSSDLATSTVKSGVRLARSKILTRFTSSSR